METLKKTTEGTERQMVILCVLWKNIPDFLMVNESSESSVANLLTVPEYESGE